MKPQKDYMDELDELKAHYGWNDLELAQQLNTSPGQLSKWRTGKNQMTNKTRNRILKFFISTGVFPEETLEGNGNIVQHAGGHAVLIGKAGKILNHVPEQSDNADSIRQEVISELLDSEKIPAEVKTVIAQIYFTKWGCAKNK